MAYPYYPINNQYYMQDLQNMKGRIEDQIRQMQNPPVQQPITQNFQIAPNVNNEIEGKYANSIDDVRNTFVMKMGVFVNKDFSTMWIKNVNGDIRVFSTEEIFEMDEKDREIMALKKEIENMKGMMLNATEHDNTDIDEPTKNKVTKRVSTSKRTNAK